MASCIVQAAPGFPHSPLACISSTGFLPVAPLLCFVTPRACAGQLSGRVGAQRHGLLELQPALLLPHRPRVQRRGQRHRHVRHPIQALTPFPLESPVPGQP